MTDPLLSDDQLMALCVYDEASGEPFEGQVAVAQVILNRMRLKFMSDGTVAGTVLRPLQFSGFWFASCQVADGRWKYTRVCHSLDDAWQRAWDKFHDVRLGYFGSCQKACAVARGEGPLVPRVELPLPEDALSYYNPSVTIGTPKWATPDKFVKAIANHSFYRS